MDYAVTRVNVFFVFTRKNYTQIRRGTTGSEGGRDLLCPRITFLLNLLSFLTKSPLWGTLAMILSESQKTNTPVELFWGLAT